MTLEPPIGPAAASAPRIERERAVLRMLRGENSEPLTVMASDDKKPSR
jgi:hypothetical protein